MARRAGGGAVQAAGANANGEPPPSTLAAKIVDSRADTKTRRQPEGKELFTKLLQEYLNDPAEEEANLETNARLVLVVAEAGLDAALRDDPFSQNDLIDQARDSIAVIKRTIQRLPALILHANSSESSTASLPIFLVIFPKIIALLGRPHLEAIHQAAIDLLTTCVVAPARNMGTWTAARVIEDAVFATLADVLCAAEQQTEPPARGSNTMNLDLPSQEVIATIRPDLQNAIVVPRGSQAHINSITQASFVAIGLVASLTAMAVTRPGNPLGSYSPSLWHLEILSRIVACLAIPLNQPKVSGAAKKALAYLCRVASLLLSTNERMSSLREPEAHVANILRAALLPEIVANDKALQQAVAKLLLAYASMTRRSNSQFTADPTTIANIARIAQNEQQCAALGKDLNAVFAVVLRICAIHGHRQTEGLLLPSLPEADAFEDDALRETFAGLALRADDDNHDRPTKRRRTEDSSSDSLTRQYYAARVTHLAANLGLAPRTSLIGAEAELLAAIISASPAQQEAQLVALADLPCAVSDAATSAHQAVPTRRPCETCQAPQQNRAMILPPLEAHAYGNMMSRLIEWPGLQRLTRGRLLIMFAVQKFINHTAIADYLDISKSPLGQWCLKSMQSSLRELRVVAGRCMALFVRSDVPVSLRRTNSAYCLNFLKALGERNNSSEKETLILAWAQVACFCGDDERGIALLELVESLGAPHALICAVGYEEIERCAAYRRVSVEELFRPYWHWIAPAVVKDFRTRPQRLQTLCDLLGINNVNRFFLQTQAETIPWLVLNGENEVLHRIATARNATIKDICLQPPKHLGLILAHLLLHITSDSETSIIELLSNAAAEFAQMDLSSLIRLEPITIACEMFKAISEVTPSHKSTVLQAIKTFASLAERKTNQSKPPGRSTKVVAQFLENHIFGILTRFSDMVDSPGDIYGLTEKRRNIRAIGEMISMTQAHFNFAIAIPQIKACLQSALSEPDLCDDALGMWSVFVSALATDDLDDLLEYTFAVIVSTWNSFSVESQHRANVLVQHLFKQHNSTVREKILYLPSFRSIPLFAKYENEMNKIKIQEPLTKRLEAFIVRCASQNALICEQGVSELLSYLLDNQRSLQELASSPEPHPVVVSLIHALIDASSRYSDGYPGIISLSAQCIGIVGCIDNHQLTSSGIKEQVVVLSNFARVSETVDFIAFFLEHVLIKAFHSAANSRIQNYLAWAMQELLKHCEFKVGLPRSRSSQSGPQSQRWFAMSEAAQNTLFPFFDTKYMLNMATDTLSDANRSEAIFKPTKKHSDWLRELVSDLLRRAHGENTAIFFPVLSKIIRGHDLSIPSCLLPYIATNVMLAGTDTEKDMMQHEMLAILETNVDALGPTETENVKKASENVFEVLDYMSKWLQRKRKQLNDSRTANARSTVNSNDFDEVTEVAQISIIEQVFESIPADIIARRAMECRSFARAIYHWEQWRREVQGMGDDTDYDEQEILSELQKIYVEIDEPDGIEGISANLKLSEADTEAKVLEYRMHGRWEAALSWYELELERKPSDWDLQLGMLSCFKESGQLSALLQFVDGRRLSQKPLVPDAYPFAAEAAWSLGKFDNLRILARDVPVHAASDFRIGLAHLLLTLQTGDTATAAQQIASLRDGTMSKICSSANASVKTKRQRVLELHALFDVEEIAGISKDKYESKEIVLEMLDSRLRLLGAVTADKEYLLGIRRAAMRLSTFNFTRPQHSSLWLTSARLSRKAGLITVAFDAINHASELDANSALVEYSRLLWKDGSHKKAVQTLSGAIGSRALESYDVGVSNTDLGMFTEGNEKVKNELLAKAHLLHAKWLEQSGQAGSSELIKAYQTAVRTNAHWEKGHYYLGRFYNNLLESEKNLPIVKQSRQYMTGETIKLVIDNFVRSLGFGSKYHYQTVPKIMTLWLDFGQEVFNDIGVQRPRYDSDTLFQRKQFLEQMHAQITKYVDRLQPYLFYTALPQMISRIGHPHKPVWETLAHIIVRTTAHYPRQSLWSLLAVAKSSAKDKMARGAHVLTRVRQGLSKREKGAVNAETLKALIIQAQELSDNLLTACEHQIDPRITHVELLKDLSFHQKKLTPCGLVVPIERTLMATLPTTPGAAAIRSHKAFPYGDVLIDSFLEDVLVLSSLQRPRKLTVRGSDGNLYGLLCKPKDDLRKDQRLMEFNAMIERSLKRNVEASKRQLYIKTYGVVPLNEECGTIEWVDGLKPMRDIIISSYKSKQIRIDYNDIRNLLTEACANLPKSSSIFTDKVLGQFPPVLYEWFIDMFPEPEAWYAARLQYTRSCAVMSIVGHILGLGDRHGENVLLESGSGGVFHVDFNCLFDKGLTFEKPEKVPFRLTHNMVHAFGACGVEGPFRRSAEVTLKVLRQHEDTLMTIMETFLYDPTADFMGSKKKKNSVPGVPETPTEVLEIVRNKLRGFKHGEKVPLSVEGYVEDLIKQATSSQNLAEMYIGWCAFF